MADDQQKRNFNGGLVHGTFLSASIRLADVDLILPAFVSSIADSKFLIALLPSIYLSAGNLPQTLFANFVEPHSKKKPFLFFAIYTRVLLWFIIGITVMVFGMSMPIMILSLLFASLLIYSMTGSLGGVAYTDIIGKTIERTSRAKFYATKQALGSLLAFASGFLVRYILSDSFFYAFPRNYAVLFLLSALALLIGVTGFYMIKEPTSVGAKRTRFKHYFPGILQILRQDRELRVFLLVRILAGFHIMIIPYYIVFFKEEVGIASGLIGIYLAARVVGGALSNLAWMRIAANDANLVILICLFMAAVTPLIAVFITPLNPLYFSIVFILAGSGMNARQVGFNTQLLELAPAEKRPTYRGIMGTAIALTAPLPFLAGAIIEMFSFQAAFFFTAVLMFVGVIGLGIAMLKNHFA